MKPGLIQKPEFFKCRNLTLPLGRKTYVMGILNVTPDSFSDGGNYDNLDNAVARAMEMVADGADIIDIGGESTRPGHMPVSSVEEIERVVPVIEKLVSVLDVPISIDTSKAEVAEKALFAGAHIINDIWGLQKDPDIGVVAAKYNAGVVMMHNKSDTDYIDIMSEIIKFLDKSAELAGKVGISHEYTAIDPGFGFGKTSEQNLQVLNRLKELDSLKLPVLIGTSRKSMIGKILGLPVGDRVEGTAATVAIGIAFGADFVRVHDIRQMVRVARMSDAIIRL